MIIIEERMTSFDNIMTLEDWTKFRSRHFNELLQKFHEHLDTVQEEYREAVVEDFLDRLVEHGWIDKEFRDTLVYNKDYKGN